MAVAPVDMESLKVDDVVIKSTPQRNVAPPVPAITDPPKEEPKKEEPKKEEAKPKAESEKKEVPPVPAKEVPEKDKPAKEEPPKVEEVEDEVEETEFDWEAFSQEVGVQVDSNDAIVESLKELASFKSLSPALQKAIEIERNKGDVAAYFKAIGNDPKDLSDRDALWEQYVADNPKRVAANPKFARLDFDRKLDKEYSLLTEYEKLSADEQEEFLIEHKAEIDYLKEKRKFDAETARATLQEKRDQATFASREPAKPDEKKIKEIMAAHERGYKKALEEFDVVSLGMGKDFEFNIGITDSNKKVVNDWMKNPDKFLNELGFSDGKVDYDVLAGWATMIADIKYGNFGERLRQALIDNKDIATLETTLDAPGVIKTGANPGQIPAGDDWDAVGEAFAKKRLESRKR